MANQRTIPSLDGLRAVAIILVISCHLQASMPAFFPMRFIESCGSLGVDLFFAISGYLITFLLLKELDRDDSVNFRRFYLRRAFRIFPPFYAYLAVVAIMRCLHADLFTWRSFTSAATYVWNYDLQAKGWLLGHTWSLSLEEQFYLLWPALLGLLPKRTSLRVAIGIIVASPAIRVTAYAFAPAFRSHIDMMLPTHLDTMMVGCFLALAANLGVYSRLLNACTRRSSFVASAVYLGLLEPTLEHRFRGAFYLPAGISLMSISCGVILLYSVRKASTPLGRALNNRWVRHVGVISYSLYLWQQLFTGPRTRMFPLNVLFIAGCAELSYWLVERPSFQWRDYLLTLRQRSTSVSQRELFEGGVAR